MRDGRVPMDEVTAGLERWEAWCDDNGLASEDYVGFVVGLQSEQTVWSCSACGGLVLDRYCHVRWHLGEADSFGSGAPDDDRGTEAVAATAAEQSVASSSPLRSAPDPSSSDEKASA